jgi:hypothetical protein
VLGVACSLQRAPGVQEGANVDWLDPALPPAPDAWHHGADMAGRETCIGQAGPLPTWRVAWRLCLA